MDTIQLLDKKTNKINDYELYIGNFPQHIMVGLPDGEHRGYTSLASLVEDYEIFTPTSPNSEQVEENLEKKGE